MVISAEMTGQRRDLDRYDRKRSAFAGIADFLQTGASSRQILSLGRIHPLDIHISPAGADTTVVVFHAALTGNGTALPVFAGARMLRPFSVNLIQVADPGLYAADDLEIGWFAGTRAHPIQEELVVVLRHLFEELGGTRKVFFGPSAGGYAALYYGSHFPDAVIVPVNPQTILERFNRDQQAAYCAAAWNAPPEEVWGTEVDADLRETFAGHNENDILYVQNERDPHLQEHMEPFLATLPPDRIEVLRGDWGRGHQAPPTEELSTILSKVLPRRG
ncbi:hypothetical protein GCM10011374_29560 [Kocuria dechangensis]|uniref:Alpha/beta hydrolase n=1 Tax=Kocuria dechangensis TaxID=1176249 RepID=A0A917H109_9MICC|nr:hypothetical protein [Kocuria dechangensis]GGG64099.1 hypothetical protein GCM10011374_29560 [Kocuria dechangensis]